MITNRFERAVSALVQAYFDDTLYRMDCAACAVGTLVAAGYGVRVKLVDGFPTCPVENSYWGETIAALKHPKNEGLDMKVTPQGLDNIRVTGYSFSELDEIENAFMFSDRDDIYNALMATIDKLCEIEGIADAGEYKAMFAKPELV